MSNTDYFTAVDFNDCLQRKSTCGCDTNNPGQIIDASDPCAGAGNSIPRPANARHQDATHTSAPCITKAYQVVTTRAKPSASKKRAPLVAWLPDQLKHSNVCRLCVLEGKVQLRWLAECCGRTCASTKNVTGRSTQRLVRKQQPCLRHRLRERCCCQAFCSKLRLQRADRLLRDGQYDWLGKLHPNRAGVNSAWSFQAQA